MSFLVNDVIYGWSLLWAEWTGMNSDNTLKSVFYQISCIFLNIFFTRK